MLLRCRPHLWLALASIAAFAASASAQDTYVSSDGIRRSTKGKQVEVTGTADKAVMRVTGEATRGADRPGRKTLKLPTLTDFGKRSQLASYSTPWDVRRSRAEAEAALAADEELKLALRSEDNALLFAALQELRNRGSAVEVPLLARALRFATQPEAARQAIQALQELGTEPAYEALATYVVRGGIATNQARDAMGSQAGAWVERVAKAEARRNGLLQAAADAQERRPHTLAAIEALAEMPGEDVSDLLRQLSTDWNTTVREVAGKALVRRAEVLN